MDTKTIGFCESCCEKFYTDIFTEVKIAGATWLVCITCAQLNTTN